MIHKGKFYVFQQDLAAQAGCFPAVTLRKAVKPVFHAFGAGKRTAKSKTESFRRTGADPACRLADESGPAARSRETRHTTRAGYKSPFPFKAFIQPVTIGGKS